MIQAKAESADSLKDDGLYVDHLPICLGIKVGDFLNVTPLSRWSYLQV